MNNDLIAMQGMLMRSMKRLDEENVDISNEIARSNALSNSATTFIKSINANLRIKEIAEKNGQTISSLRQELGIEKYDK